MIALPILLAMLVLAAPAHGHLLSERTAANKARSEALLIAGTVRQERPRVSVRSCARRTQHIVACRVRYRFVGLRLCLVQRMAVSYVGGSRRLRVKIATARRC